MCLFHKWTQYKTEQNIEIKLKSTQYGFKTGIRDIIYVKCIKCGLYKKQMKKVFPVLLKWQGIF